MSRAASKTVLIRVDGSRAIGLGHVFRMRALAAHLKKKGLRPVLLTRPDRAATRILRSAGCPVDRFGSWAAAINRRKPRAILQDMLQSATPASRLRSLTDAKLIYFDEIGRLSKNADALINSIVFHWSLSKPRAQRLYEGLRYMILAPSIRAARRRKSPRARGSRLFLAFGGTDTQSVSERMLQILNRSALPMDIRINLGPGRKMTRRLRHLAAHSPHNVKILRSVPSIFDEFNKADLVLCAGGNMLYELAALGVPSASVASAPHELRNLKYWSGAGTTIALGRYDRLNPEKALDTVCKLLLSRARRLQMSRKGPRLVDGRGTERVAAIVRRLCR